MAWPDFVSGHAGRFAAVLTPDANVGLNHAVRADGFVTVTTGKPCLKIGVPVTMSGM